MKINSSGLTIYFIGAALGGYKNWYSYKNSSHRDRAFRCNSSVFRFNEPLALWGFHCNPCREFRTSNFVKRIKPKGLRSKFLHLQKIQTF